MSASALWTLALYPLHCGHCRVFGSVPGTLYPLNACHIPPPRCDNQDSPQALSNVPPGGEVDIHALPPVRTTALGKDSPRGFQCSFSGVKFFFLSADWYLDIIAFSRLRVLHYTITYWLIPPSFSWSFERKQLLSSLLHGGGGGGDGFEYLLLCMQILIL